MELTPTQVEAHILSCIAEGVAPLLDTRDPAMLPSWPGYEWRLVAINPFDDMRRYALIALHPPERG